MISINPDSIIINNRYTIKKNNISKAAICPQTSVSYSRNPNDEISDFLLCIRLKSPQRIPGLVFASKTADMAFPVKETEIAQISSLLSPTSLIEFSEEVQIDECVIEAKKSSNNYTRAGTTGSHPYNRAGIISPVILVKCQPHTGKMHFKYIGTTSRLVKSEYFSQNPEICFDFSNAEVKKNYISVSKKGCMASVQFFYPSIERDENKTGIWSVCAESHFDDICQAAHWINCFYKSTSNDSKSQENHSRNNEKLLEQLNNLHDAGILSEDEWLKKTNIVKSKDTP